jgi:multiple sugar transport system permease protein
VSRARAWRLATRAVLYLVVSLAAFTMDVPFFWMVSASLKDMKEIFVVPPAWIPPQPTLDAYYKLFEVVPFGLYGWNSVKISVLNTIGMLIACSLGAYGFARLPFPGKDALFAVLLATMMVPSPITLIPQFILFTQFGWVGSHLPLIVPAFFGGAFGTFLLRQFFLTIPRDLEDAARMDGASEFRIFRQVILPLTVPALLTLGLFHFMYNWNDLLWPLIVTTQTSMQTLPAGLALFMGEHVVEYGLLMAGSILALLPMIVMFLLIQRKFVEGIATTGFK